MNAPELLLDAERRQQVLNAWQRDFPLLSDPWAEIGQRHGMDAQCVLEQVRRASALGELSRLGGVFGIGAGGAGMLCAMAVPPMALEAVAACVSAEDAVNHNYERDHHFNLWFVVTATDEAAAQATVRRIERNSGRAVLRLPMLRAFRIDLGFDVRDGESARARVQRAGGSVPPRWRALAARLENGLPLEPHPYAAIAHQLGCSEEAVFECLRRWSTQGILRRFGLVLRHHELGWSSNAMVVFDLAPDAVDRAGPLLAAQHGVTLCYERTPAPGWPFRLYAMFHGRSRARVLDQIEAARTCSGLTDATHAVLFSCRRFKQTGSRYFSRGHADA